MIIKQMSISEEEYRDFQNWNKKNRDLKINRDGFLGIEEKIFPLVRSINFAGFYTTSSCEGHITGRSLVPFIGFRITDNLKQLLEITNRIKIITENRWELTYSQNPINERRSAYVLSPVTRNDDSIQKWNELLPIWHNDIIKIANIFDEFNNFKELDI